MNNNKENGPLLLAYHDSTKIYINKSKFTIGRGPNNSYVLNAEGLSRSHCLFKKVCSGWYITNWSPDGIIINDNKIKNKKQILSHGDIIRLTDNLKYVFIDKNDTDRITGCASSSNESEQSNKKKKTLEGKIIVEKKDSSKKQKLESSNNNLELGEELHCALCSELLIEANKLNCSHVFCKYCISEWQKEHTKCPSCLEQIFLVIPMVTLDKFINDILETVPDDFKEKRAEVVNKRKVHDKTQEKIKSDLDIPSTSGSNESQGQSEDVHHNRNNNHNSSILEAVADDIQCPICTEYLLQATILNCSHSFCKYCIELWRKRSSICPICRIRIKYHVADTTLDCLIEKIIASSSEQLKSERTLLVQNRQSQNVQNDQTSDDSDENDDFDEEQVWFSFVGYLPSYNYFCEFNLFILQ